MTTASHDTLEHSLFDTASKHTRSFRLTIKKTSQNSAYFQLAKTNSPAFGGRPTKVISTKTLEQYGVNLLSGKHSPDLDIIHVGTQGWTHEHSHKKVRNTENVSA
jgi:hypothetical protein